MDLSIRHVSGVILKRLLVFVGLLVLVIAGLLTYKKLTSRPLGSPPIGYENRLKYERGKISDYSGFDNIPVDLWFGKHDGKYDTTHFRIASDYFSKIPNYHGQYATIYIVWPSLRSIDEENEIRKANNKPSVKNEEVFIVTFSETGSSFFGTDKYGTGPVSLCEPIVHDIQRGVKYCNENSYDSLYGKRRTHYWPLDGNIKTPRYKNSPSFSCYNTDTDKVKYDRCDSLFSFNNDLNFHIDSHEKLALEILREFSKFIEFIRTLEVHDEFSVN
jgi:hypothetical protein